MGNESHHQHTHNYLHHQNLHIHHKSTFLPMICTRSSIKDVSRPQCRDHSMSFFNDPLSPRIDCMGQVKRDNKISGFSTSHRLSFTTKSNNTFSITSPIVKYSKLKKLFSGKNLSTPTSVIANSDVSRKHNNKGRRNENFAAPISIENMDPPLPVNKRVRKMEEEKQMDSLWKRRAGGTALKGLQLQQIHDQRDRFFSSHVTD